MIKIIRFSITENKNEFLEKFSSLPRLLNSKEERKLPPDQYWSHLFSHMSNLERELFILEIDNFPVARISTNIYRPDPHIGFFGCLEYDINNPKSGEIINSLLDTAETWLKEKDVREIIGPIDFSIWFGYRLKSQASQHQFKWEPHAPVKYYTDVLDRGYHKDMGFLSSLYESFYPLHDYTQKHYEEAIRNGFHFQKVNTQSDPEIKNILQLNLSSFKKSYLYDEVTELQFNELFINFIKTENAEYVFVLKNRFDKDIGMIYAFDDQEFLVIKTILITPDARKGNLGNALVHHCLTEAKKNGIQKFIGAMIREDNNSLEFLKHLDNKIENHYYHLLKKTL